MITRYYSSLFSNKESSIRTYVDQLENNLFSLFENLPSGICFVRTTGDKAKFIINFEKDDVLSTEEYVLLSSVFQQYYNLENPLYDVYFISNTGKLENFSNYVDANPGGFKLLRAILFLDFTNALEFMHNFFAFQSLEPLPKFKVLPSFEKKDALMGMREAAKKDLDLLSNEHDRVKLELTAHIKVMDSMHKILSDLELGYKLHKKDASKKTSSEVANPTYYQNKIRKISALLSRIDSSKVKFVQFVNYVTQNPNRTSADSLKKKMLENVLSKREKMKQRLVDIQNGYLRELNSIAIEAVHNEVTEEPFDDIEHKITEMHHKLADVEKQKKSMGDNLSSLRDRINSINLRILDIDTRLVSDFKPVDIDKLAYDNIILLDVSATMAEKLVRFTSSFFIHVSPEAYLTVHQRRDFFERLNPYLRIRSISTYPIDSANTDFMSVN